MLSGPRWAGSSSSASAAARRPAIGYNLAVIAAAHEDLARSGLVSPVDLAGPDARLWLDCDLASLAENRLGDRTDPRALDAARRADWKKRATSEREMSLRGRSEYERCYWLLEGDERVGTLAVATSTMGGACARISSFYVFPTHRGRGVGRRALERLEEVLARNRLGLRLETNWSWQRTVRFYLRAGMWVYMWKRELAFIWDAKTPRPQFEIGEHEASLSVPRGDGHVVLSRARRRGDALELDEPAPPLERDKRLGQAYWHATSTFSLALALAGWPLVRSQEQWKNSYYADAGPPEALAYKIGIWEAWDRDHGWIVETPRIPGIPYPTWGELEARWDAENAAFEATLKKG
jgi:GNAT superfamily N-acetyltransferase